ncbi:MAG: helix-turn-helix transcriptional regulator [Kordiimonadaceae bacterium]|nr:helix-turn-helix transcriptional regulator [Kordiimonadaceae bacterium]MBO6569223.1 helix-turn-helix transcriptional regulator [Kordiimonadaceae bacterium]MBO6964699.1 helix-turn-helix transcriptional regulator [Kordiimonadaceae bacterium]
MVADLEINIESLVLCVLRGDAKLDLPVRSAASFHYILSGKGQIEFSDRKAIDIDEGSIVFVPANWKHRYRSFEGGAPLPPIAETLGANMKKISVPGAGKGGIVGLCGTMNVHVRGARALFDLLISPIAVDANVSRYCRKLMDMVFAEANRGEKASFAIVNALIRACLISITEHSRETGDNKMGWLSAANEPKLWPALEKIMANPSDKFTVSGLADLSGMSRARFAKLFRETYGRGPMEFLNQLRMQQAAHLLSATHGPIKKIASKVGFGSRSAFTRNFKNFSGLSPTDYRTEHQ